MKENVQKTNSDFELTELVNEKFGTSFSYRQIKDAKVMYGLRSGKRGNHNAKPLLAERIESDHVLIKVSMTGTRREMWIKKHRWVWEQAHGKIPKGMNIIFLDNNPLNCELENLAIVTDNEALRLIRLGLRFNDRELTHMGLAIVRHETAIHKTLMQKLGKKGHKNFRDRVYYERKKRKQTRSKNG